MPQAGPSVSRAFVYGTLLVPEIAQAVVGRRFRGRPATLGGYARYRVRGAVYPGVVRDASCSVEGLLYEPVTEADWHRLDAYEGDQYERCVVRVHAGDAEVEAGCYVILPECRSILSDESWDIDDFVRTHASRFRVDWD